METGPDLELIEKFSMIGDFVSVEPYGNGHINDTFMARRSRSGASVRYLLQRINQRVFRDPEALMDNISRICRHLQLRYEQAGYADAARRALTVVPGADGKPYNRDEFGSYWRCYRFIENTVALDVMENPAQAFQAAKAFGEFQLMLSDLPGMSLAESIPGFHDTAARLRRFDLVLREAPKEQLLRVGEEIAFFQSRRSEAAELSDLRYQGVIPARIVHNDTKLNNVLLDRDTGEAVCVIDLDTVMPGIAAFDFGDLVRTAVSPAAEDEPDISLTGVRREMFQALADGYLSSASGFLTEAEAATLVSGGILMTYETGLRFLTDFLEGNVYYKTRYPDHNLVRCRTQIAIIKGIEDQRREFEEYVKSEYAKLTRKPA